MTSGTLRRATAAACIAVLALATGACSTAGSQDAKDTKDTKAETTTTTSRATTTTADEETTTTEADEPDAGDAEALATSINPTIDDFSDGWVESPADSDGGSSKGLETCITKADPEEDQLAAVDSPTFSVSSEDGSAAQVVETSTLVLTDQDTAEAVLEEVVGDDFARCTESLLLDSIANGNSNVVANGFEPADTDDVGDEFAGIVSSLIVVGDDGTRTDGQIGAYFVRTENVVTAMVVVDIGVDSFDDTVQGLASAVAAKQSDALH